MRFNRFLGRFDEFVPASVCSTGIEEGVALAGAVGSAASGAAATAAPYLGAASLGMSILGGVNQSAAQQQAGAVAYQNALLRKQAADVQANQEQQAAGEQVAAGQRQQLESIRKGVVMGARAKAVMAASGAGVDDSLVASLVGEGNYAGDVASYNAGEKARGMYNEAAMTRWSGDAGVWSGANTQAADNRAADATLIGTIGKGALSFADKYGGPAPNGVSGTTGDSLTVAGSDAIAADAARRYGPAAYNPLS